MLLLFFVLLFFLTSERSDEKKKYLKCQNNSSNTSEFPHNKIYFQFLAVLFPHFFSLFVLSHSPKFFCVFYFCQAAIRHQASNTLKLNWRQFKVRIKSLSCNYNNDKKMNISRHNLHRRRHRQLNFVFKHFTLDKIKTIPRKILNE